MPRVHVIDDDPVVREVLSRVLGEAGWTVTTAEDGRDAVADVTREQPDVVLLDVTMPGPDGWTVLGRLRSAAPSVRVVMLTGRTAHDDVVRARRAGADDFLAKPLDGDLLLERLTELLRRPAGERDLLL
jgi:DNA-binding response OmpR family regulator